MAMLTAWTGRTACALQEAFRDSNESFAARLGIGVRTVAAWHQKPALKPKSEMQQLLDTALEQAPPPVKARFTQIVTALTAAPDIMFTDEQDSPALHAEPDVELTQAAADAERRLSADRSIGEALEWLDRHAGWEPGTSRRKVASQLATLDLRELQDRGHRRGRVSQRQLVHALTTYYEGSIENFGTYTAQYDDEVAVTSILTRADWLDLDCRLGPDSDRLILKSAIEDDGTTPDQLTADLAARRLAETLATGTPLVNTPLYRLTGIDVGRGMVTGTVGLVPFARYALTMDLLEGEIIDAASSGAAIRPGAMPLRDRYLPDLLSVVNVADRLCSGGGLALCAIARDTGDYLLLIQERSGRVLNAARRLAVIPKGFHEPWVDYRTDTQIGATLRREMEEELFGRDDVDSTIADLRTADPMHPSRLSEPMRWLSNKPDRLRLECTGFGLNLVSGNFEFACLAVIDDEKFWTRYGGHIEANWEAGRLRRYSSLDRELVAELIGDVAWSNEGLFALLQGLRRLSQIGGPRVNLPTIEWEIQ